MRSHLPAIGMLTLFFSTRCFAAEPNITDVTTSLNSSWVVITGVLVFLMQAGFALVESGMARAKNSVNVIMKNYMDACVCSVIFWALGYGLMFGVNNTGWFGESHFSPVISPDGIGHLSFSK